MPYTRNLDHRRYLRFLSLVIAAVASVALAPLSAVADTDDPQERELPVTIGEDPAHKVECYLSAFKPNYSGDTVTGTGGIKKCKPTPPDACAHQTELQRYDQYGPGPGTWVTIREGKRHFDCPPPKALLPSRTANLNQTPTAQG